MTTLSATEIGVLARAVSHAPSVHNTQPWILETHDDTAELYEQPAMSLPRHDASGRDRMISCGAALTNLVLAVRNLGWDATVSLFPDTTRPDLVARVETLGRKESTAAEIERYSAIFRRRSYRAPFSLHRIPPHHLRELAETASEPGTQARVIDPRRESAALAELLGYAGAVLRDDHAYQRELAAWTTQFPEPDTAESTLPWAGLVRADTRLPDTITLTERLAREGLLVLLTTGDTHHDHLRAGAALQHIWLAAVTQGLAASVLTQPLHLHEVRAGLIERLDLAGFPQLILRVGYPTTSLPVTPRIPVTAHYRENYR